MRAISAAIKSDTRGASNSSSNGAIYNTLRPKVGSPPNSKAGGFASSGDLSSSGEIPPNSISNGSSPLLIRTKTQWEKRIPTSLGSSPTLDSAMSNSYQLKESQAFMNFEESDESDSEGELSWPEDNSLENKSFKRYGSNSAPNTPTTSPVGSPRTNNNNIMITGSFSAGVHRTFNEEQKKDLAKEEGTEEIAKKLRCMWIYFNHIRILTR